ncbi:MAG: type II toxin-antitoxin system RelE/ParE family toxin [Lachnospiraceae bacterium]|nr:type II toxin-antitoxin system RelE/ParE family toxin [Lachnospiraceae bacterium]
MALDDIKSIKKYIIDKFKYKEYADNVLRKIKRVIKSLEYFPLGYNKTGYIVDNLDVFFKPYETYMIFYVVNNNSVIVIRVLKDNMDWQSILKKMNRINN